MTAVEVFGIEKLRERGTVTLLPDPAPSTLWCPFISVDDHVLEPADLFERRLPAGVSARGPRVVVRDDGNPYWLVDDALLPIVLANGASGRPMEEWGNAPQRYDDFRQGVHNSVQRLSDMDLAGMWSSLCFPSMVFGFCGSRFLRMADRALGLACVRAYNDWLIEEWCAADPDRYIPCQLPWLGDPEVAAAEIRANAARGFRAVTFTENPEGQGLPSIHTRHWDPFFEACEETRTVVNLHVGSSGTVACPSTDTPQDARIALFPVCGVLATIDWIFSRIPLRFPNLQIVLSEAGISWVPMVIERLTRAHRQLKTSRVWTAADPHPVDVLRRSFFFTSLEDPNGFRMLDVIGERNVMVECDYPHPDSIWPGAQEHLRSQLDQLPADQIRMACYENAADLYRSTLPPESLIRRSVVGL
jgi:predicted TIM-barrel fold metal-dependent hydrolase